jgi:hypothetical protein
MIGLDMVALLGKPAGGKVKMEIPAIGDESGLKA